MKYSLRMLGALLMMGGTAMIGFAANSYVQVQQVAAMPANVPGATPDSVSMFDSSTVNLPAPIDFPMADANRPSPTPIVIVSPTTEPSATGVGATGAQPANSPIGAPDPTRFPTRLPSPQLLVAPTIKMLVRGERLKKDIPVREAGWRVVEQNGQWTAEWNIPFDAAGHHDDTPEPGQVGNAVISGHHNLVGPNQFGAGLFAYFWDLNPGDKLYFLDANGNAYKYVIGSSFPVLEQGQPLAVRQQHAAQIMGPSSEPIVTLVTCWAGPQNPFASNTYRWIIVGNLVGQVDVNSIPPAK